MPDTALLGPWVRRFLMEHVIGERNLARIIQFAEDFLRNQQFRTQVFVKAVHSRRRIDDVSSRSVLVMIARGDVAEENLSGMNTDTSRKIEVLVRLVEPFHAPRNIQGGQTDPMPERGVGLRGFP